MSVYGISKTVNGKILSVEKLIKKNNQYYWECIGSLRVAPLEITEDSLIYYFIVPDSISHFLTFHEKHLRFKTTIRKILKKVEERENFCNNYCSLRKH